MNKNLKPSGFVLAAAAAMLFATAPLAADQPGGAAVGKCWGVNACKGKSECKSSGHGCKSQNSCRGKGFVMVSKEACEQIGGKFEAEKG